MLHVIRKTFSFFLSEVSDIRIG